MRVEVIRILKLDLNSKWFVNCKRVWKMANYFKTLQWLWSDFLQPAQSSSSLFPSQAPHPHFLCCLVGPGATKPAQQPPRPVPCLTGRAHRRSIIATPPRPRSPSCPCRFILLLIPDSFPHAWNRWRKSKGIKDKPRFQREFNPNRKSQANPNQIEPPLESSAAMR
jgi:hypothetical protein